MRVPTRTPSGSVNAACTSWYAVSSLNPPTSMPATLTRDGIVVGGRFVVVVVVVIVGAVVVGNVAVVPVVVEPVSVVVDSVAVVAGSVSAITDAESPPASRNPHTNSAGSASLLTSGV
jgi:hypothetical protein